MGYETVYKRRRIPYSRSTVILIFKPVLILTLTLKKILYLRHFLLYNCTLKQILSGQLLVGLISSILNVSNTAIHNYCLEKYLRLHVLTKRYIDKGANQSLSDL
jgi:hypothetical protein